MDNVALSDEERDELKEDVEKNLSHVQGSLWELNGALATSREYVLERLVEIRDG